MIIVLKKHTTREQIDGILELIKAQGLKPLYMPGTEKVVLGALGDERKLAGLQLENLPFVEKVVPILTPYKLASRDLYPTETVLTVGEEAVGTPNFTVIAGPCSVENEEQIMTTAEFVSSLGIKFLRGGAFKPRSSPYAFQGLGVEGLKLLAAASKQYQLNIVTEVMSPDEVEVVAQHAHILQIGARNMYNIRLLEAVGATQKPVLLKRGMSATIEDLLMSAEYVLDRGNRNVILCERGIRTFENAYRNTLDITAVPVLKQKTHLPVIVDPSHAAGYREFVVPLAKAALVSGADGIIVETHPDPAQALSDGRQSLYFKQLTTLMRQLRNLASIEGKILP